MEEIHQIREKFTFILPAYKAEYFKDALQSILNQKYDHFKVIVSDDASPADLKTIVDSFNDGRIDFRRNPTNIGAENLSRHWNILLEQVESEYVIVASDDDLYHPEFLSTMDILSEKYPAVGLIRARSEVIDANGKTIRIEKERDEFFSIGCFIRSLLDSDSVLCIGNYVFKTAELKEQGGFFTLPYAWKSDTATQVIAGRNGVVNSSRPLFSFRMSGLNISSGKEKDYKKDRMKLESLLRFNDFMDPMIHKYLPQNEVDQLASAFKKRLEGEARSYLWTLSISDFLRLFFRLIKEKWFMSFRNKLSFFIGGIFPSINK